MADATPFDKILGAAANAHAGRSTRATTELSSLPLGTTDTCKGCGAAIELREMPDYKGGMFRYFSDCPCIGRAADRAVELAEQSRQLQERQRTEIIADPVPIAQFTFETFDAGRLSNGAHILGVVQGWLNAIDRLPVCPSYEEKPRACLYFYSPGKGRGKTHLAAAVVNQVRASGRRAMLIDENDYIETYWSAALEARQALSDLPARRAWLTAIDDMGQRESTGAGLRDAWYDVINPRWLKRGWTIITSNWTPDQLRDNGTINEATWSRIGQMTNSKLLVFDGVDQRLVAA